MCVQMFMHVIAHRGYINTVRESTLKVDSGRKILYFTRESNQQQYLGILSGFYLCHVIKYVGHEYQSGCFSAACVTDLTAVQSPVLPVPESSVYQPGAISI